MSRPSTSAEGSSEPSPPEAGTALRFVDATEASGLSSFKQENGSPEKRFIPESVGGGVAFLDYDRDGHPDLYFTNGGHLGPPPSGRAPRDALFRNRGDGTFEDVTERAGLGDEAWTNGVTVSDVDGDGWPDLYLTNFGANVLLRNRGDGTFEDVTRAAGVGDERWSTGAAFFDADGDGDQDLFVANYLHFDASRFALRPPVRLYRGVEVMFGPRGLPAAPDALYRNDGGLRFTDITEQAGIRDEDGYGFQVVVLDHDDDGDLDVLVANDSTPNHLWLNDGEARFREGGLRSGVALSGTGIEQASMGVSLGDFDADGRLDLYMTNFSEDYNVLYRNDGGGLYRDVTSKMRLAEDTQLSLGWSCALFDPDNDGDLDIFAANGHVFPQVEDLNIGAGYRQLDQLFENRGPKGFRDVTLEAGPGFQVRKCSRGAAIGDYDSDGDLDIVVSALDDGPTLLRNETVPRGHWIAIRAIGRAPDRDAVGARVTVHAGGRAQAKPVLRSTGFLSGDDPRLHFGLGAAERVDRVEVRWPDGTIDEWEELEVDRFVEIERDRGVRTGGAK